jgi:hypothetical protein
MSETITVEQDSKTGFLKDICAYFRDFLDTDFKRQAAPKRNITLKDPTGNLTGIDLSKYPELGSEVWRLLRKPIGDNPAFALAVPRAIPGPAENGAQGADRPARAGAERRGPWRDCRPGIGHGARA